MLYRTTSREGFPLLCEASKSSQYEASKLVSTKLVSQSVGLFRMRKRKIYSLVESVGLNNESTVKLLVENDSILYVWRLESSLDRLKETINCCIIGILV